MTDETKRIVCVLPFTWRGKAYEMNILERAPLDQALLPKPKSRVISFSTALACNALVVLGLLMASVLIPTSFETARHFIVTSLAPLPTDALAKPQLVRPRRLSPPASQPVAVEEDAIQPGSAIPNPVAVAPVVTTAERSKGVLPDNIVSTPAPSVDLPLGTSAIPDLQRPRPEVQTGGFAASDGVHDNGKTSRTANIAEFGTYELPVGPGVGNSTGGKKGVSGVVSSAGFGNGIATDRKMMGNGIVQQGLFADGRQTAGVSKPKQVAESPHSMPVEILFKPKPNYTDSARINKIEGEVLLEVVFTTSGEVNVVRVVQGLGYGLEDAAEAAARQIRFKPAQQDGSPVDSTAIVHIRFELAS